MERYLACCGVWLRSEVELLSSNSRGFACSIMKYIIFKAHPENNAQRKDRWSPQVLGFNLWGAWTANYVPSHIFLRYLWPRCGQRNFFNETVAFKKRALWATVLETWISHRRCQGNLSSSCRGIFLCVFFWLDAWNQLNWNWHQRDKNRFFFCNCLLLRDSRALFSTPLIITRTVYDEDGWKWPVCFYFFNGELCLEGLGIKCLDLFLFPCLNHYCGNVRLFE